MQGNRSNIVAGNAFLTPVIPSEEMTESATLNRMTQAVPSLSGATPNV
jgi:hypothetical protein